jgi:phage gpG-like protein
MSRIVYHVQGGYIPAGDSNTPPPPEATMTDLKRLYRSDTVAWSRHQAAALRAAAQAMPGAASNSAPALDWENLAEEIEALGKSERAALRSHLARIMHHLVKLEYSSAVEPRNGCRRLVRQSRQRIGRILADSPSLAPELSMLLAEELAGAVELAIGDLDDYGEIDPQTAAAVRRHAFSEAQVLGDWFPPAGDGR